MPEPVRLVVREARRVGPDHVAAHEPRQAALDERVRHVGGELAERAAVEDLALDRRQHEQGALVAGQPFEPGGEQRVERRGHGDGEQAVRRDPACAVPAQQVVVDQHCQQLLGEQRVAVGRLGDPRRRVGGQWPAAEQVRDQSPAVAVVERLEQHRHGLDLAAAPRRDGCRRARAAPCRAAGSARRASARPGTRRAPGTSARPTAGRRRRSRAGGAARSPRRACAPPRRSPRRCRRRRCRGRARRRSARRSGRPCPRREGARRSQRSTTPRRTRSSLRRISRTTSVNGQ